LLKNIKRWVCPNFRGKITRFGAKMVGDFFTSHGKKNREGFNVLVSGLDNGGGIYK
jgi:hypothetical protein